MEALNRADVILALGTRINQGSTGWDYSVINPDTRIIQVDIDPFEIGRNYPLAVGIVGDAGAVAQQLTESLSGQFPEGRANPDWTSVIAELKSRRRSRLDAEAQLGGDHPWRPSGFIASWLKCCPRTAWLPLTPVWLRACPTTGSAYELPRTMFNYAGQGGLGMGLGVGLGTKLGRPDRPAVSLQGDGGFLYTSQELNTAVRKNIPLVSIVLNNGCHGAEKAQQQRYYDQKYIGVDPGKPAFRPAGRGIWRPGLLRGAP